MALICLIAIAYFYIMNAISQVNDALINAKMESKIARTTALLTAALICSFLPSNYTLGNCLPSFYNKFVVPFNGGTGAIIVELASESSFVLIQRPKDSQGCARAFRDEKTPRISARCPAICECE